MKRIILIIGLLISLCSVAFSQDQGMDAKWEQANTFYINGDYAGAVKAYEGIDADGYVGAKLFYNLGNAYFKAGNLGKAILNYNKAQKLAPYDRDVEYNLGVANSYIKDRIEPVPEFFVNRWIANWRASLDSNTWGVLSLILFALTLAYVLLFLLSERKRLRKTGFFAAIVTVVLFGIATTFAAIERRNMRDASQAVVLVQAAAVKSAPEQNGSDLFIIHEGTKVDVFTSYGDWAEIMIADGNKGWIATDAIEWIAY